MDTSGEVAGPIGCQVRIGIGHGKGRMAIERALLPARGETDA
jgi:hypothetical protein